MVEYEIVGEEDDFPLGQTHSLKRLSTLDDSLKEISEPAKAIRLFYKKLSEDLNIAGVAISMIKLGGGVFTHFIVQDMWNHEAMAKTLEITKAAYPFLESAMGRRAGYSSCLSMQGRSFEETVADFRKYWDTGYPNNPLQLPPNANGLDLVSIVKFE